MAIDELKMNELLGSQQGELDGVATYLKMAKTVSNPSDVEAFKRLAADEGKHASVFKKYTGKVLEPKNLQANAVAILYRLLGKRILYPIIAKFEYDAMPRYERMMLEYPEVEEVKNDEKRHGDTLKALAANGEYNDRPLLPYIAGGIVAVVLISKIFKST
ncbi:MAG: rubrerythrin [Lachnospiraceae bacterium]|nr:rubrerythrin [Lachnospiraceae bacterium]